MPLRSIAAALVLAACLSAPACAQGRPYRVTIIGDDYQGDGWLTGVRIELDDGWKTYWRMPGEAGIPPQFTWKSSEAAGIVVLYPLPARHADASGETVGYEHEVVFPVRVTSSSASALTLNLDLFFAVCRDICIPAQAKASVELGTAMHDPGGSRSVVEWMARVPVAGRPVTNAAIASEGGKPVLLLNLSMPVNDIFVESAGSAYFRKPVFSADGREARLLIDNVQDEAKLKGVMLNLTISTAAGGLEQSLTLP